MKVKSNDEVETLKKHIKQLKRNIESLVVQKNSLSKENCELRFRLYGISGIFADNLNKPDDNELNWDYEIAEDELKTQSLLKYLNESEIERLTKSCL